MLTNYTTYRADGADNSSPAYPFIYLSGILALIAGLVILNVAQRVDAATGAA